MLYIFDLDHTLIDSTHRALTLPDGTLDLKHWRDNCTRKQIMRDRLLPLGVNLVSSGLFGAGDQVIACTARVMGKADFDYLRSHGLRFDYILSRPEGNDLPDYKLKEKMLRRYAILRRIPFARLMKTAVFWDDQSRIRDHFEAFGCRTFDPATINGDY